MMTKYAEKFIVFKLRRCMYTLFAVALNKHVTKEKRTQRQDYCISQMTVRVHTNNSVSVTFSAHTQKGSV